MNNKFLELTGMKVISNGQVGVGIAALRVAQCLGMRTGGFVSHNYNTLNGPQHTLKSSFKCEDLRSGYLAQTKANIMGSDASLVISSIDDPVVTSALEYMKYTNHPYKKVDMVSALSQPSPLYTYPVETIDQIVEWLVEEIKNKNIFTLNVVGNNSKDAPGIFIPSFMLLVQVFHKVQLRICDYNKVVLDGGIVHLASQISNESVARSLADNYQHIPELHPRL